MNSGKKDRARIYDVTSKPDFVAGSDVFAMARSAFAWLVAGPDPVSVDGRAVPGLPPRPVPLDELGTRLLARSCPQVTRDGAWAYLITRSRAEGGTWTVACVGLALPSVLRAASLVTRRVSGDTHDINAAVLTGFLAALPTVDLARPAILARLYYAAYRAGLAARDEIVGSPIPAGERVSEAAATPQPEGHPDLVLARAVAAGAITTAEADLISVTRLGDTSLAEAAAERGSSYKATAKARERAEAHLRTYLTGGPVDTDANAHEPHPTPAGTSRDKNRVGDRGRRPETARGRGRGQKTRQPMSPNAAKSRIASRGAPSPARPSSRARPARSGPAAPTRREVRSCD
ncbi:MULTISPECIES: sigma-70 family RNA polymerase sigma factor [Prauserella salsuginis group]|uniref:Sigma-70 family RNA polymerase sigma factor n=1 Tax=Prauserella salsuginis TaxID=387889 RepID=A0ABW6FZX5_9PSEU|nr:MULTISPECIES: sigma-70 family RNA polymerase sigma factor [Prauserella salsuginis group]MCR3721115.1 hypothetical protein [Prauserella flava]MCR3734805.1 hypothetical protein [Prauserella salsuginis]